jgi:sugar phosphate isomerase/epimerase
MTSPRRLSVAHLTALDLSPPALIRAAARAGFDAVGLRLLRVTPETPGWPLMDDAAALRATLAALTETGLAISDIEFVRLAPETRIADLHPILDCGAALGAGQVIAAPYDPEPARLRDRLAALTEAARDRGLGVVLEFFPWTVVPDLTTAGALAGGAGCGILVDALHFDRSGSTLADLALMPAAMLPFAHLCDAPVAPPYTTEALLHTARAERLPPGAGQIDLAGFLAALPPGLPLALEVPMTALTRRIGPEAMLAQLGRATRDWLARAGG